MALAVVAAGSPRASGCPSEGDRLEQHGNAIAAFGERLESGMIEQGTTGPSPSGVRDQGFSGYGFPESHAASFALLVYASSG